MLQRNLYGKNNVENHKMQIIKQLQIEKFGRICDRESAWMIPRDSQKTLCQINSECLVYRHFINTKYTAMMRQANAAR